ncbi:UDP-glycosyltransferase 85A5-like [Pyrus ussuriensis x Pyrus communis]|uniref:Glycosyltransferase n=1 Tax=Pyrus ussuriensis x Pyrus communis TaxID=2448454 RepID=A0A5N5G521_9ROSA|nr:UDP-glycosyltransferase 85A5-like [Pyrus ussuriensis x Pyrus communis]
MSSFQVFGKYEREMMSSVEQATKKGHAVFVPYPAQGHVNPMMQLAKLLHSRGFHITFVNTEFNHNRLIRSNGPDSVKGIPDFVFETIPDGLPPSDKDGTQDIPALCDSIKKTCFGPFKELVTKINSSSQVPQVTCIVADGVMTFGCKVARELGIPEVVLWTASACGFMGYLQYNELVKRGMIPFKDENFMHDGTLDTPIDWIPGMKNVRLKDIPSFIRVTDLSDILFNYLGSEARSCLNSSAILFNTFDEFEHEVLEGISIMFPNIYTIGPLNLLGRHFPESKSLNSNLWKEDAKCSEWLDKKKPNSVVYVNYGSITMMTDQHLVEFAWGLANSKQPFLWIVRADVVKGDSPILPDEFFEEIKDRGYIAGWCAQDQVLAHPSVGVFLTHSGWNSTIESISHGVPVICWPFFAEQQTNCRYSCTTWEIGMEVSPDVKRDEIEALVKEMMEGEGGIKKREKAKEWKKKAIEATDVVGSSYNNFERLFKEVL